MVFVSISKGPPGPVRMAWTWATDMAGYGIAIFSPQKRACAQHFSECFA
jgi:hypothetical protein